MSQTTKIIISLAAVAGGAFLYQKYAAGALPAAAPIFIGDGNWVDLKLKAARDVSKDTRVLTFEFPEKNAPSGLVTASAVLAKFVTEKGSNVIRPYTPISDTKQLGSFDLLIKKYETGKMGNHIFGLKPSDTLSFKGPILKWKWEPNQFQDVTLIGGGTGITPLYQIITQVLKTKGDNTKINLLYGSQSPADILLKPELDALAAAHPDQFKITYFVDKSDGDSSFVGKTGYISKDDIKAAVTGPSPTSHVFVCGPPPLAKAISGPKVSPTDQGEVTGILAELGYDKTQVFKF